MQPAGQDFIRRITPGGAELHPSTILQTLDVIKP